MLEILVPAIVFAICMKVMAYGKRKKKRYISVLPFTQVPNADGLANSTLVGTAFTQTCTSDMYFISADITVAIDSGDVPAGPVQVGLAHSDYSDAEIEQWRELTDSWDTSNLVDNEIRKRKIRMIGTFSGAAQYEVLNDGKPIRIPLKFMVRSGYTLKFWVFNQSGAALNAQTDFSIAGKIYARQA